MSITRNNHYVPQWYQEGFFEAGQNTLAYLDLTPEKKILPDGRTISQRALFNSPTSRAFFQTDLYSTFFGSMVSDEIEKKLFGDIDTRGSLAVRAYCGDDEAKRHKHFKDLFEFIDAQKMRTPRGLDWLKAQYPGLSQNELMVEMQGLRMMNCTIWTEGVREIVSAEDAETKFIVSDHPVTVFNHEACPDLQRWTYPNDPSIVLKGSQTLFPLSRDFCLILTNLEFAENASVDPLARRTFARNFRQSMVRTDSFIRDRKLNNVEVSSINYILKRSAKRYIAAGNKAWLEPEVEISASWEEVGAVLRPPEGKLFGFGGELFAKFDDGHVHYQDAFGRTEKPRDFLLKEPANKIRAREYCGCGFGRSFGECCKAISVERRPSWTEHSIRERNFMLLNAIMKVLELDENKDWLQVRRELTDEKIGKIYSLFEGLWPRETDIIGLLPKPDGRHRTIYTGHIHPETIFDHVFGAPLYFGEMLIPHPFMHPGSVKKEFSPVENPQQFRCEFLKSLMLFLKLMPLVEMGFVNLVPDPCEFDDHLRQQMMAMAESRIGFVDPELIKEPRIERIMKDDARRGMLSLPEEALRRMFSDGKVDPDPSEIDQLIKATKSMREGDELSSLQTGNLESDKAGGQFTFMKLAPNFEMAMYLAQATGASIVTDSMFRWQEIQMAMARQLSEKKGPKALAETIEAAEFSFVHSPESMDALLGTKAPLQYAEFMRSAFRYLSKLPDKQRKQNFEAGLRSRFETVHSNFQSAVKKSKLVSTKSKVQVAFPIGGIRDHTVNRLLLMSNSEFHLRSVPMAFYISST